MLLGNLFKFSNNDYAQIMMKFHHSNDLFQINHLSKFWVKHLDTLTLQVILKDLDLTKVFISILNLLIN